MGNEKFKDLANDMLPLIEAMKAFLKKHEVDCLTSIKLDAEGYFSFSTHDSMKTMYRIKDGDSIDFEYMEEVQ